MNWVVASLLMYSFSAVLYLFIRKAQVEKIPIETYSLWMFGLPAIGYLLMILLGGEKLLVTFSQLVKLIGAAVFFSWLGNLFSQRSILYAPNPGYALIISKSYVVFTTLVAVALFASELTFQKVIAIILIVLFSALILLSEKKKSDDKKRENLLWFWYSLGAFFCWGFLALMSKHLLNQGLNASLILFYICLVVTSLIVFELKLRKVTFRIKTKDILTLTMIGLGSMFFNLFMQFGFKYAPNPGYINAVNTASISLVTLLSAYFFKDELTYKKIIGVIGVTGGLILLFL